MDLDFWHDRWRRGQIGFHSPEVNARLLAHGKAALPAAGARVLVPLCGKSRDLAHLAAEGYGVVGVELSPLAAEAFFAESGARPEITRAGAFTRYAAGGVEILCGDFFALEPEALPPCDALYDRAALVALPPDLRARYAAHLARLLPAGARGLLVSFAYDQSLMPGPPFAVLANEIRALYEPAFTVNPLSSHDVLTLEPRFRERGLTSLTEDAYALTRSRG